MCIESGEQEDGGPLCLRRCADGQKVKRRKKGQDDLHHADGLEEGPVQEQQECAAPGVYPHAVLPECPARQGQRKEREGGRPGVGHPAQPVKGLVQGGQGG